MAFKFNLLSLNTCPCDRESNVEEPMAKKTKSKRKSSKLNSGITRDSSGRFQKGSSTAKKGKSKKLTSHQRKFKKAATKCHSKTKQPKSFGSCMKKELKK